MRPLVSAALVAALWASSCGHVGDPLAPRANIPGKITDLLVLQRGPTIYIQFSPPPRTTEGIAITTPLELEVAAGPGITPLDIQTWAARGQKFTPTVEGGLAKLEIPASPWVGREMLFSARAVGMNRKDSGWSSPPVVLPVVAPPAAPENLEAQPTAQGVRLTWTGAPGMFRVYRMGPGEKTFSRMADVEQNSWTDPSIEFGKPYDYLVQRIVKLEGGREAESVLTAEKSITPKKTFPPAIPTGLHAAAAPGSIEIAWNQNTEPDLEGYRVYRAVGDGPFQRIAEVSQIPAYSDHAVEAGKKYRYAVSAFDPFNNESERSAAVEVVMP
jgi:hypothetical protein